MACGEAEAAQRQTLRLQTEAQQLRQALQEAREALGKLQEQHSQRDIPQQAVPSTPDAVLLESNQMLRSQKVELMQRCQQVRLRPAVRRQFVTELAVVGGSRAGT